MEKSLLNAIETGETIADKFVRERLIQDENGREKSFYAPLPRSGIKTMSDMIKPSKVGKKNIVMSGESMYIRLVAINAHKNIPIQQVFSYENAAIPLSMFSEDGQMISTTKSNFMHKLESVSPGKITTVQNIDAILLDGHAVIQVLKPNQMETTFNDMAKQFMNYVVNNRTEQQIHVVFDRYFSDSLKSQTRMKRYGTVKPNTIHIFPEAKIPKNWKLFLTCGENKSALAQFYSEYMKENAKNKLLPQQSLYISGVKDDYAIRITKSTVVNKVRLLTSNHEEADTKLILHAVYAADIGAKNVVVSSPDTDVLVLLLGHRASIGADNIYLLTGNVSNHTKQYIPIHGIFDALTRNQHNILMQVYCISGCDTVSGFYGHGKAKAFNVLMKHATVLQPMADIGSTLHINNESKKASTRFVCLVYGKDETCLNKLRCDMANKNILGKKLPPTNDSFMLHLQRAAHQLIIWKQSCQPTQMIPNPVEYGYYKDENNNVCPKLMTQEISAPELLNNLSCDCEDFCTGDCLCVVNNQPCTSICGCGKEDEHDRLCMNRFTIDMLTSASTSDEE